jgi:Uma2 family endonuclease
MSALRNMTAEELLSYSHPPFRTELIAGRLFEMEPAGGVHGVVAAQICGLLTAHVLPRGLGKVFGAETGYQLERDPDTVRAPDASFLSRERIRAMGGIPASYLSGPPDLAFEVTSPGDRRGEVESKTRLWLLAGTEAVVVVDPRRGTATVHRPNAASRAYGRSETLALEGVLPEFRPAIADFFD